MSPADVDASDDDEAGDVVPNLRENNKKLLEKLPETAIAIPLPSLLGQ